MVITSCRYLEERFQECTEKDGVVMATSVEKVVVALRKRTKQLGRIAEKKEVRCEILAHQEK